MANSNQQINLLLLQMGEFVNRALDEVENGRSPGIILVCPNSTGARWFKRLKPYTRVFMGRNDLRFKDYQRGPNRFDITIFCIVLCDDQNGVDIHRRFCEAFEPFGDVTMVVDMDYVASAACTAQLIRKQVCFSGWWTLLEACFSAQQVYKYCTMYLYTSTCTMMFCLLYDGRCWRKRHEINGLCVIRARRGELSWTALLATVREK